MRKLRRSMKPCRQTVRRDRTCCFLPDRGTRRVGARGDVVRERRFDHECGAGRLLPALTADRPRLPRSACSPLPDARRGLQLSSQFDLIHFPSTHYFPLSRRTAITTATHGRLDLPDLAPLYQQPRHAAGFDLRRAASPDRQCPMAGDGLHGLPEHLFKFHEAPEDLAFLGRISPEKRVDRAIEIARRVGLR